MRVLLWFLRLGLFFLLFAFALNNQHEVALKSLFGHEWRAPMVFVVLAAFVAGCALGVVAMLPTWLQQRRVMRLQSQAPSTQAPAPPAMPDRSSAEEPLLEHPPRDGI